MRWRRRVKPARQLHHYYEPVRQQALNYLDVMSATGLVPEPGLDRPSARSGLGRECAGTVTAVGPDVTGIRVGERVAGSGLGCLSSHVVLRAGHTLPVPDDLTCAEAATLPVVSLTVLYSLGRLARLAPGETLLVHGAAGGVGLAAVQYAQHVGAQVIATAGTPAKRDMLHMLGVEHVLDSRSLRFSTEVMDITKGAGVDVVLNSLAGEAMVRSLRLLKPFGRFVELGKRDALGDSAIPLAPFLKNLTYFFVDVSALLRDASAPGTALFAEVREAVENKVFHPYLHQAFPAARVDQALDFLQHSRHVGKVVVDFGGDAPALVPQPSVMERGEPAATDTFLITGGFSGFGAATARHLAARGARHLTLVGRRGADTPEGRELLDDLAQQGVQVAEHAADASRRQSLRRVLDGIDAAGLRLAGVIHAAMVLDDAPLAELTDERLRAVLEPKLTAGYLLDSLTRDQNLDFFVTYSSGAGLVGNAHQAPYAAGNMALDALVQRRRAQGLPGLSVQWGALTDTGYAHRAGMTGELDRLGLGHLGSFSADEALAILDRLLEQPDHSVVAAGQPEWERLSRFLPTLHSPRTAGLLPDHGRQEAAEDLAAALRMATPEEALTLVEKLIVELFAEVAQLDTARIDVNRRLEEMGYDSLMGLEMGVLIGQRLGYDIPLVELAGATNIEELTQRVVTRLRAANTADS
jgi:NADPH:quinone reductase-like Zn-dependent oxidoreductase/NADP-dependent 3-hydroxy acid dehydrogenase YdfG/acyl carrier protein